MEDLLETSGFKEDSEEASGLSEELDDITDEPIGMGIWRSLCNSLTKSIDLTLIRRKRSQTNESSSLDPERNPSSQDMKGTTKGVLAKIMQLYDLSYGYLRVGGNSCHTLLGPLCLMYKTQNSKETL